jgi:signal transduction histidine kinase
MPATPVFPRMEAPMGSVQGNAKDVTLTPGGRESVPARLARRPRSTSRRAADYELKLLSFLSHDLSNNLGAVDLHLKLLKQWLVKSPQFADGVSVLDQAHRSIEQTIDGMRRLLTYAGLHSEARQPSVGPVNLQQLLAGVVERYHGQAASKGLEIGMEVSRDAVVQTDPDLIVLVLQNLVGNAVKYSGHGTISVRALDVPESAGGGWALAVSDEGAGIPPQHMKGIFAAFRRGECRGEEGVGLGLAIASEAASLLGAELAVESQVGAGSTFVLAFPATRPPSPGVIPGGRRWTRVLQRQRDVTCV